MREEGAWEGQRAQLDTGPLVLYSAADPGLHSVTLEGVQRACWRGQDGGRVSSLAEGKLKEGEEYTYDELALGPRERSIPPPPPHTPASEGGSPVVFHIFPACWDGGSRCEI